MSVVIEAGDTARDRARDKARPFLLVSTFRDARIEDAQACAELIFASGEREFTYLLRQPPAGCIEFLTSAFRSSAGRFSWRRHFVAVDASGVVLSTLAAHDGRRMRWDDLHFAWVLIRFFGFRRTVGMLLRGLVLESELPKPRRDETLMAHCATLSWARGKGVFSQLLQHALKDNVFDLDGGKRQLVLDVLDDNYAARILYERTGFVPLSVARKTSNRLPRTLRSTRMRLNPNPEQ